MGKVRENTNEKKQRKSFFIYSNRVSYVEDQAVKNLLEKFSANQSRLIKEFSTKDPNQTGK